VGVWAKRPDYTKNGIRVVLPYHYLTGKLMPMPSPCIPRTVKIFPAIILLFTFSLSTQAQRPNIIYIMTDDMGYGDLSCYGRKDYTTPNLDKLASQGIKFINAYSAAPVCTPTRAAFMTGRFPARTQVGLMEPLATRSRDSSIGLTADIPSLATLVRNAGYETALIGKWHLGFRAANSPNRNGFDHFFGIHSGAADYISHKGDGKTHDLYENEKPVSVEGYFTDIIADKAIGFLKQSHKKPFFLSINFTAPHWPWQGPADKAYPDTMRYTNGGSPATYAAMMKSLDDAIGNIMSALDDMQLSKNTLVIFTNDNGGERFSDMGGLTNSKMSVWEGGIRVPAFLRWPGKIEPGKTTSQVAITMDWTATILAAAGTKPQKEFPLDGINLLPILTSEKQNIERELYWRVFQRKNQKAVRYGDWKFIQDENGEHLFNIANDQAEKNDLKDTNKAMAEKLKKMLADWEKSVLTPIPL
jgi:arylsulfatase A-like enzyme